MKGRPICAMTHPWTGRRAFFPETGATPQDDTAASGARRRSGILRGGAHAFFFRPPAMYGIAKQTGIR
ncbi:hypothetical protein CXU09_08045 [Akkermansia muciniphila]|uniref:Uncharacterized protein n=1 Tax=Akkermansia muciniphila TaxID=239935 RepID=A0AAP8T916_9BACT|nr:hypothetical protein CXU09_08045 [Akkermansia muciniphila]